MKLERWDAQRDGPLTESALWQKLETLGYEVDRYEYPPGTRFPSHSHPVDKADAILSGSFKVTMGGRSVVLEAGDILFVPRGTPHSAEVVGDEAVVTLDAVKVG